MLFNSYDFIRFRLHCLHRARHRFTSIWRTLGRDNCVWESIEMIKWRRAKSWRGVSPVKWRWKKNRKRNLMKISIHTKSYRQSIQTRQICPLPASLAFIFSHSCAGTRRRDFVDTKYTLWCLHKITVKTICKKREEILEILPIEITEEYCSRGRTKTRAWIAFPNGFSNIAVVTTKRRGNLIKFKLFFCDIDTWWLYQRDLLRILYSFSPLCFIF